MEKFERDAHLTKLGEEALESDDSAKLVAVVMLLEKIYLKLKDIHEEMRERK